jgi:2-succinyl-5-enolpyruvyl-6-hydroxy-3-cyclohexene-1-carboxylate synthase
LALTLQSEFCATLVDEFVRAGVRHAVLAPGSRSSPLAIALLNDRRIELHVRLDERSGAFFALGTALGSRAPALMLTTSGTAAAEVHAAVIEADLARVPLIICTADRPPELHHVGAPQTVDQSHLYGSAVRLFVDAGVPDETNRAYWRSIASRLVAEATAGARGPGPVQCNLPFREPLTGPVGELPEGRADGKTWHAIVRESVASHGAVDRFLEAIEHVERGLFLVGKGASENNGIAIMQLADKLHWPVLNDGRAFARVPHQSVIAHSDALLRSSVLTNALQPELIVHIGAPHASRVVATWSGTSAAAGTRHVLIDEFGAYDEPERVASLVIPAAPDELIGHVLEHVEARRDHGWLERWRSLDDAAERAIAEQLGAEAALSEPEIARLLIEHAPDGAALFCSSSMPIRDLEWFAPRRSHPPEIFANRGANGIDGVVSTTLGVAASRPSFGPTIGLVGDLAFLHDLSGLVWGESEEVPDALFVVIDNNGGGIFSFLAYPGLLDTATFERGFGTPQRVDIAKVAASFGFSVVVADGKADFARALVDQLDQKGLRILLTHTDREENVAVHERLNASVIKAVEELLG